MGLVFVALKINKMMRIYIVIVSLFFFNINFAQQLSFEIKNPAESKLIISRIHGENATIIDTIGSIESGVFHFSLSNKQIGFYRISFVNRKEINFIYNDNDVEIQTDAHNILDSLKVIKSESNKLYYAYLKLNKTYKTKTELLQFVLVHYPKDDDYYRTTQAKVEQLQVQYLKFVDTTSQKNPNSFIARYIKSSQLPIVNYNMPLPEQLAYLKTHALDNVDFKDSELTNSDLFTNKTIEYLTYYRNPQLPKELLEKEFMIAVDSLLNKAKVNYQVYKQIVEYLIDGFKKYGFEEDVEYVVKNYVVKDDICLDKETEASIGNMVDQMEYLRINTTAPDIVMKGTSGKEINMNKVKSGKMLVLFYASWCPHCKKLMPKLVDYIKSIKNDSLKVLAVSLDSIKTDWLNFVKVNGMNWINVNSSKGWDCKAAHDYYIYATPTMFLLNNDKRIIGKPLTIEELKKELGDYHS
jgi:peroxiredoxin